MTPKLHKVAQGESLSGIAKKYGFADWKTIYNHGDNADFKKKRPNPNLIFPGDRINIPEKEHKQVDISTDAEHTFEVRRRQSVLRLVLKEFTEPIANANYELHFKGLKKPITGMTDGQGKLEAKVPPDLQSARLVINDYELKLAVGHLNPMKDAPDKGVSGLQARLTNLGYGSGPADGIIGRRTHAAIRGFQADQKITESGRADNDTISKLEEIYGC